MNDDICAQLDGEVAERHLLDHPFYRAWSAGALAKEDLSFYATQYWRQVESFPGYLTSLGDRLPPSRARQIVLSNLADELDDDHAGLWAAFAEALGVSRRSLEEHEIERETARCVDRFRQAAASATIPFALGMLYAYESQTPAVAAAKLDGLEKHYGVTGNPVRYFELHAELDVEHAADLSDAIDEVVDTRRDLIDAKTGARAGADALLGLLDGVARVRGIDGGRSAVG